MEFEDLKIIANKLKDAYFDGNEKFARVYTQEILTEPELRPYDIWCITGLVNIYKDFAEEKISRDECINRQRSIHKEWEGSRI